MRFANALVAALCPSPFAIASARLLEQQRATNGIAFVITSNHHHSVRTTDKRWAHLSVASLEELIRNEKLGITEAFRLQTCNRDEIYGMVESSANVVARLRAVDPTSDADILLAHEAIIHAARVVSGQDAFFPGDNHVRQQCVQAFQRTYTSRAQSGRAWPEMWNRILQHAKRVRTRRRQADPLFAWVVGLVPTHRVVIVGAGAAGRECAWRLRGRHDVTVVNRTPRRFNGQCTTSWDELARVVDEVTTIIYCADAPLPNLAHSPSCLIDLTNSAQAGTCSGALTVYRLVDLCDIPYASQTLTSDDDSRAALEEFARSLLSDLHCRRILAAECRDLNRHIATTTMVGLRYELLQRRHRLVQRIRHPKMGLPGHLNC